MEPTGTFAGIQLGLFFASVYTRDIHFIFLFLHIYFQTFLSTYNGTYNGSNIAFRTTNTWEPGNFGQSKYIA